MPISGSAVGATTSSATRATKSLFTVYFGPEKAGVGGVFNPHALWADRPNGRKRQGSGGAVTISTAK